MDSHVNAPGEVAAAVRAPRSAFATNADFERAAVGLGATALEAELLRRAAAGSSMKIMARDLALRPASVTWTMCKSYKRIGAHHRGHAVALVMAALYERKRNEHADRRNPDPRANAAEDPPRREAGAVSQADEPGSHAGAAGSPAPARGA